MWQRMTHESHDSRLDKTDQMAGPSGPPKAPMMSFSWKYLPQLAREVSTRAGAAAVAAGVPRDCGGIPSYKWLELAGKVLIYPFAKWENSTDKDLEASLAIFGDILFYGRYTYKTISKYTIPYIYILYIYISIIHMRIGLMNQPVIVTRCLN